jgi:serine/threonine protein kinase
LSAWTTSGRAEGTAASPDALGVEDQADRYQSPEQRRGDPPDHRSDLFSLGVILREMLTDRVPSDGASPLRAALTRPSALKSAVPADFDAIVARATAEHVEDRYQSAVSLAAEPGRHPRRSQRRSGADITRAREESAVEQLFATAAPPLAVLAPAYRVAGVRTEVAHVSSGLFCRNG